jgi:4-hydroxybenzoate polyprenyltransferase
MYYSAINLSGFRIFGPRQKAIAALGLASCLVLMFSLPIISWAVGAGVLALAVIYHRFFMRNFT